MLWQTWIYGGNGVKQGLKVHIHLKRTLNLEWKCQQKRIGDSLKSLRFCLYQHDNTLFLWSSQMWYAGKNPNWKTLSHITWLCMVKKIPIDLRRLKFSGLEQRKSRRSFWDGEQWYKMRGESVSGSDILPGGQPVISNGHLCPDTVWPQDNNNKTKCLITARRIGLSWLRLISGEYGLMMWYGR